MTAAAPLLETLLARQFAAPELDWPALTAQLSAAARARLGLMRADRRRQEFVLGRALAARLLHVAVGGGAWDLVPLANGKPVAVDAHGREHAAISLSHSRGHVLCAVAPTGQLGCDIEAPRPRSASSWRRLANFDLPHPVFALHERRWILEAADAARDRRLYALWTIKEAIGKAGGHGLRAGLARFAPDLAGIEAALAGQAAAGVDRHAHGVVACAGTTATAWYWQLLIADSAIISVVADAPLSARWPVLTAP